MSITCQWFVTIVAEIFEITDRLSSSSTCGRVARAQFHHSVVVFNIWKGCYFHEVVKMSTFRHWVSRYNAGLRSPAISDHFSGSGLISVRLLTHRVLLKCNYVSLILLH